MIQALVFKLPEVGRPCLLRILDSRSGLPLRSTVRPLGTSPRWVHEEEFESSMGLAISWWSWGTRINYEIRPNCLCSPTCYHSFVEDARECLCTDLVLHRLSHAEPLNSFSYASHQLG